MYNKRKYLSEAFIKRYSIPIGIVGLALTTMSTFGVSMEGTFNASNFWAMVWLFVALIILVIIALDLALKDLNVFVNSKFNIGELPPVLSITGINDDENAKIILHPNKNISIQKDAVVTIILCDEKQGDIEFGLGVITDLQADGKIALVATPKRALEKQWRLVLENAGNYTSKLRVRTIVDRNYVNDDYLYKENYEIGNLSKSANVLNHDGTGVKL